ncbi:universal stress protein [Pseudodesulfovibrio cashew]|uniref:Universal stress protein n=2 Tax=Pseudodesulfovibrio cashew TaxID=2678688 RepID=A0A6I6JMB1_9BACT|nr:universal stress protein [Pseudodesulfovibrio cashew]
MKTFFKRLTGSRKEAAVCNTPMATEAVRCDRPQCKILIVSKGESFSRGIADYAISMASKTRSSLVALNLDETGEDFKAFSDQARKNIEYFSCKAEDAGLAFCHEVRQGDEDSVVAKMHEKDPFRYVMDDTAVASQRSSIPVYTRATLRAK